MATPFQTQLLATIDVHLPGYFATWQHLISLIMQDVQKDETLLGECVATWLQQRGFATQFLGDTSLFVYAESVSEATQGDLSLPTLLLYSPAPTRLTSSCVFVARLLALAFYQEVVGALPVHIKWLIATGDTSYSALEQIFEVHRVLLHADGCLCDEEGSSPLLALGTKGLLRIALDVQAASTKIHAQYGAIVPNAIWRLVWALSSFKDAREEVLIDGFYDTLTPLEDDEVELLHKLPDITQRDLHIVGIAQPLLGLQGFQLQYVHLLMPTCVLHSVVGGSSCDETIPFQAHAEVGFSLVPDQDPQEIYTKVQQHLARYGFEDVHTEIIASRWPVHTPLSSPFVRAVRHATTLAYADAVPLFPLLPESLCLSALQRVLTVPTVLARMGSFGVPTVEENTSTGTISIYEIQKCEFAVVVKQMMILMEELADATAAAE